MMISDRRLLLLNRSHDYGAPFGRLSRQDQMVHADVAFHNARVASLRSPSLSIGS
jgi:hypothetical protein